ncbi:MAG: oligosaccharide flippase family protein [Planctomycetaceae bacterium]|nr:oligosaccharide flippase family protein [Planctomycetaceae bacterium]
MTENHKENNKETGYLRRLLGGSMLSIVNLLVGIGISFIMAPIFIHTLGPRHNGIWVTASVFTGWYALLDFGLSHAVSRFFTKSFASGNEEDCNTYASTGLFLYVILGGMAFLFAAVIGLVTFFFADSFFTEEIQDINLLAAVIILVGFAFALDFPLRSLYGVTTGAMRHDLAGITSVVFRILGAGVTLTVFYFGGRLISLVTVNAVLVMIQIFVYYLLARHAFPKLHLSRKNVRKTHAVALFGYSFYGFIAQIGDLIIYRVDNLVVGAMMSLSAVTHYNIAMTMVDYYKGLLMYASAWMVTWLTFLDARKDRENTLQTMVFGYKFCSCFSGFIVFGLVMWGKPFLARWMGTDYLDAMPCLVILAAAATIQAMQEPNIRYLYATSNHHYFAFTNVLEGVLNLGMSILLVRMNYGMVGVALGTLIAAFLSRGILIPFFVCRLLRQSLLRYYARFLGYLLRMAVSLILPGILTVFLVEPNYPRLFLVGILSAVCYFPTIYYIGLNAGDRKKILGFLFRKNPS